MSSGSAITTDGSTLGWKMIFFTRVSELVTTLARPTSDPVPAVVGTATLGAMASASARGPPVAHVLKIPDRAGLAGHEGDHLAEIQRRAAAEGNHAIMAAFAKGGDAGIEVLLGGIGIDLSEDRAAETAPLQDIEGSLRHGQRGQAAVGHEERPLDVCVGAGGRQFGDASCAKADGGGV